MFLICTIVILCFIFIKFIIGTFKWRATYRGENIELILIAPYVIGNLRYLKDEDLC